jgi:membrane protein/epoxyqueuosine reductase
MQAKISAEYGVFQHSATIVLWSFMASMIVLAGAEWSARRAQTEGSLPTSGAGLENRPLNL